MDNAVKICCFCKSNKLLIKYKGLSDRFNKIKNPIDIYSCAECHSLLTIPLPSKEELADLYASHHDGMSLKIRNLRTNYPLPAWYGQCVSRAVKLLNPSLEKNGKFSWVDVGAGGGELGRMMALKYPGSAGLCIDFHKRPEILEGIDNVEWISCDMNEDFAAIINRKFDLVTSITVVEHVLSPESHVKNCRMLATESGAFYLAAPCADSVAQKVLGKRWPYLIPGEHLNIPSVKGMKILLGEIEKTSSHSFSKKTILPYTLGYLLSYLHLSFLGPLTPNSLPVRIPTGILEAGYGSVK